MVTFAPPICLKCKHFDYDNETGNTCAAYPDGISWEILTSQLDHRNPLPDDNGIQFEPKARES
jgi:hypothetical protein